MQRLITIVGGLTVVLICSCLALSGVSAVVSALGSPTRTATATATLTPALSATPTRTPTLGPNCHPSYPDFCIPPPPPDLNCADVAKLPGYRPNFRVIHSVPNPDPHRLDGDKDGDACEAS